MAFFGDDGRVEDAEQTALIMDEYARQKGIAEARAAWAEIQAAAAEPDEPTPAPTNSATPRHKWFREERYSYEWPDDIGNLHRAVQWLAESYELAEWVDDEGARGAQRGSDREPLRGIVSALWTQLSALDAEGRRRLDAWRALNGECE